MKNYLYILVLSLLYPQMPFDCLFIKKHHTLNRSDLNSNAIIDIRHGLKNQIYIGTSDSLGYADVTDPINPIFSMVRSNFLPEGGVPALKTYELENNELMIVLSGVTSTYIESEGCVASGTGVSWSVDSGQSWEHISQSVDPPNSPKYLNEYWGDTTFKYLSVTTTIYNVSYDLDVQGDYIYSTSWAGGTRRFNYRSENPEWEIVPLPMDEQDSLLCNNVNDDSYTLNPVDHDNQKAFSIYVESDTIIWVGTARGVNKGIINNDCIDWIRYKEEDGLGGYWITGIIPQKFDSFTRLWLISWDSVPVSSHKLTYTDDGGDTWKVITQFEELGIIVYNLSFSNNYIIASTDHGIYLSKFDDGIFWIHLPVNQDLVGEKILTNEFYTSISIASSINDTLIVGTADGLSILSTYGETFDVIRNWEFPHNIISAYPNPFIINEYNQVGFDKYVRFIYSNPNQVSAKIDIFDFAMDHVTHLSNYHSISINEYEITWNGRNDFGDKVANGAYFCRLSLDGKYYWTKLAVIN